MICVSTRLTPKIKELVSKICETKGMTESEFLRQLVIAELTRLSLITTEIEKLKEELRNEGKIKNE
jgi:uncharacterized small protein (DUF1192 family)